MVIVLSIWLLRIRFSRIKCFENTKFSYPQATIVSTSPLTRRGAWVNAFQQFCRNEGFKEFFWRGAWWEKGVNFWKECSGFLETATVSLHHSSYLNYYLFADWKILYHMLFLTYVCSLFCFSKILFNSILFD